jgi:NAD(P)-dependent dehydrogenase (short-subunit alcohol dehydrogenase family)
MKHVIPVMERQGGGSIINISSIASIRYTGVPYTTYYASKAAMNHLTRTAAVQYAPKKIRINAILPGLMKTPMVEKSVELAQSYAGGDVEAMWRARDAQVPMGHMGDAWDVAYAALFLASDESRYVTGIELVVDGGITLKFA